MGFSRKNKPDCYKTILKRPYRNSVIFTFFFICFSNGFSQDKVLKNNREIFEKAKQKQLELFNLYSSDFLAWKDKVDLSKIVLNPEKATANTYDVIIDDRTKIVDEVNKYIGVPYLWGGNNPDAFDCSGLVQWTLKKTHNITIPRTTFLQYNKWSNNFNSNLSMIQKGDLIYFSTYGNNPVSHVGIYVGNNQFVHAPSRNKNVMTSKISGYWKNNFIGFISTNLILN